MMKRTKEINPGIIARRYGCLSPIILLLRIERATRISIIEITGVINIAKFKTRDELDIKPPKARASKTPLEDKTTYRMFMHKDTIRITA